MNLKNYSSKDLENIKNIQRHIKKKLITLKVINGKMNKLYNIINGVMKRIHNNFILGLVDQYEYNSNMNILDNILTNFRTLERPLKLSNIKINYINNLEVKIEEIRHSLFEIIKKTGSNNIFDIIYLYSNYNFK
jgi:hypothetical protein